MGKVAKYLNQLVVGNVYDAPDILETYATDRSVLRIKPKVVALPETTDDICKLMKFCFQLAKKDIKIPVVVRGSGLDESGADLGNGLVISTEKLNRLLEFDARERLVRVQAGITLKELNTALSIDGLTIPIGGHEMETIGGLIANCPIDSYAGEYGGIMNYVERIEFVLPSGEIIQTNRTKLNNMEKLAAKYPVESKVCEKIRKLVDFDEVLVRELWKNGEHIYQGYPTIAQVVRGNSIDLMPLLFKSQGTLGIITEVILRAVPLRPRVGQVLMIFDTVECMQRTLDVVKALRPREIEICDMRIIRAVEETGKRLSEITRRPKSNLVVSVKFDRRNKRCMKKMAELKKTLPRTSRLIMETGENADLIGEFNNSMTSFLNQLRVGERVPVVTDFYVPEENFRSFMTELEELEGELGLELAIFGSYATANYSLRPKFEIEAEDFEEQVMEFLRRSDMVIRKNGGVLAGGAPEGRVKAMVINELLPEVESNLYAEIKSTFDKYNILNPMAKLGADNRYTLEHFRTTSSTKTVL